MNDTAVHAQRGNPLTYLTDAWLLLLVGLVCGGLLAGVQVWLNPRIEQNKLDETLGQVPRMVPGAVSGAQEIVAGRTVYRGKDRDNHTVGWVIPTSGRGWGPIELLIAVDARAERLLGIAVLDQKETPGLGDKIAQEPFLGQFRDPDRALRVDQTIEAIKGQPTGNQIRAISGATISSNGVARTINEALADAQFRQSLAQRAEGGN